MTIKNIYQHTTNTIPKTQKLYTDERFDVLYINLSKTESLKPHTSATDVFLLMIEGEIIFSIAEKNFCLQKGDSFSFKAGDVHAVEAVTNASFLLVK